jgi:alpha-D-xyloside xylohydrolase
MIETLKQNNIRLTAWINPFVRNDSVNFANKSLHDYFIKTENGTPGFVWWWDGPHINSYAIDMTNPTAFDWFSSQLQSVKNVSHCS